MGTPSSERACYLIVVTGLPGTGKSTIADATAAIVGAPVLAHDWAMSGLRTYPELQHALDHMDPPGHGVVGWSILGSLARAQLRRGSSVVLDGVARPPAVETCRRIAEDEGGHLVVLLTECSDLDVHRSRVEGRVRAIPNWYELDWDGVQRSRSTWTVSDRVHLTLEATDSRQQNHERLVTFFEELVGR